MLELKAGAFVDAAADLAGLASFISGTTMSRGNKAELFHKEKKLEDADREWLKPRITNISEHLSSLGADVTLLCVRDLEDQAAVPDWCTWGHIKAGLEEIRNTMKRELSLKTVIVLQSQEGSLFTSKEPHFGKDFSEKFTTVGAFELDEAAKCRALSRPTAAVFHLMRILEVGISALAHSLGIPDPVKPAERNWAVILKKIKEDGIEKRWPTAAGRMSGDGLLFESLLASLDAVKNPWRNETMHVSSKYTDDEAKHIFVAVEGFMKKLSSRMDENGLPLA